MTAKIKSAVSVVEFNLREAQQGLEALLNNAQTLNNIAQAAELLTNVLRNNHRVISCGNGGSMCDAMHFAEEMSGRFRDNRKGLAASAISDPGHLSCVSNDFGYEQVFSRYLEAHARTGDCLLGISTSGNSANVIRAAEFAKSAGINIITLTGKPDTELGKLADIDICTPAGRFADRVQELHIKVIHIVIELVERALFPDNYVTK
ncbi:MAG: SIS domain-containing protein [Arenicellales bacterium WSBS_2016_MAG_OTU3]